MNDPSQIIQAGCTRGAGTEVCVFFSKDIDEQEAAACQQVVADSA